MVGLIFEKVGIILGEEIFDRSSSRWPSLDGIPLSLFLFLPPIPGRQRRASWKKKEGIPLTTYFFSHCSASRLLRTRRGFN